MSRTDLDFRKFFESAPGLFVVLRPDFTVAAASDAYLKAAMTNRDKLVGKKFFDVFPDDRDLRSSLEKVVRNRKPESIPARKYDRGSDIRYWGSVSAPVLTPSGEVDYIVRRVDDVTSHKTVEQERDLFFTHSTDLLAIVGADGYFKRLNPAFERTLGYKDKELLSKPVVAFLHPDDVEKTQKGIATLASGVARMASANRYLCKDGSYKWLSWNTAPLGDLFFTVGRDITAQVEAEEKIRLLNLELARKNEDLEVKIQERVKELQRSEAQVQQLQKMDAIGRLAGGIAHDFNNMLGAISMYCDLLADDSTKPESVCKYVQDIKDVTTRAAALTRQLLVFSRKQIVQPQTINLNPLIELLEKMLARLIGENIKIIKNLSDELRLVSIDPSQMEQVLLNLVVNARDAMPKGGTITIETSNVYLDEEFTQAHLSVNRGHYVLLSVSDTGLGMDADTISKIFEPFFTTKAIGKGTGLGLTTVYGIVKQSRGTIWVYSEPGQGSVFKVYLPIAENGIEEPDATPSETSDIVGTQMILLVEDDEKLREVFYTMLKRRGYQVLVAASGGEALQLCESHSGPIHLLLTDVVMPGFSGLELAQKCVALREELRVLYMSGYTSDALESTGFESSGSADFIQKPFGAANLVAKVQEILCRQS